MDSVLPPDCRPNRLIAAATASSKKLLAPISAEGAATQWATPSWAAPNWPPSPGPPSKPVADRCPDVLGFGDVAAAVMGRLDDFGSDRTLVVVRADAASTHGEIRALMRELKASGAARVAVATTQAGESER